MVSADASASETDAERGVGSVHAPAIPADITLSVSSDLARPGGLNGQALRPPDEDELADLLDLAFATATAWTSVPDRFHALAKKIGIDPEAISVQPVNRALGFFLTDQIRSGRRSVELRWKTSVHTETLPPPRVRSAHDAEADLWERLAAKVTHPAARARLIDMLVLRGGKTTPDRAAAAAEAYVNHAIAPESIIRLSDGDDFEARWLDEGLTLSVGRALSLLHIAAGATAGPAVTKRVVTVALDEAEVRVRSTRPPVVSALPNLALLAANRNLLDRADIARLVALILEEARQHADLDHVVDQLMDLLIVVEPSHREAAHRLRVRTRLNLAAGREPMVAMSFLEDAARLARTHHLDDLRDEAVREMQRVAKLDHGLQSISTEIVIPSPMIDAEIRRASDGADWRESMSSWLATRAPSGDLATNERTARHITSTSLVYHLASVVLIGGDNMPRWRPTTQADREAYELSRTENLGMTLSGDILSTALDRIAATHGVPPVAELADLLSGDGRGDRALATSLARSFHRYWSGDYDGSLHTAAVHVEAGARALVMLLDEPAYTVARSSSQGKYIGLDQLLDILARHDFDPNWDRFIRTLLLGPTGQNLRHDVAHGFMTSEPSPSTTALALRASSLFVQICSQPTSPFVVGKAPMPPRPAWTIVDAIRNFAGVAVTSPRVIPALFRSEGAALRAIFTRGQDSS